MNGSEQHFLKVFLMPPRVFAQGIFSDGIRRVTYIERFFLVVIPPHFGHLQSGTLVFFFPSWFSELRVDYVVEFNQPIGVFMRHRRDAVGE